MPGSSGFRRGRPPEPHVVATLTEIPVGGRKIISIDGRSIGVFNVNGRYFALRNLCPHQQAPLCEGRIMGTTLPSKPGDAYRFGHKGQILRCPWHAWEFDITTGTSIFDPNGCRVKRYEVAATGGGRSGVGESKPFVETYQTEIAEGHVVVYV